MDTQSLIPTNDPVSHALGQMAFMMSVIRSGESLKEPEFDDIRKWMAALRAEVERLRGVSAVIDHCEYVLEHAAYQFSSHAGEQDNVSLCQNALAAIVKWKGSHES